MPFYGIFLIFILTIISIPVKADLYLTKASGDYTATKTWVNNAPAPDNINNKDSVLIKNVVNADDLKINNGGLMVVYKQLNADEITLNGPDSRLIVEEGAILNVNSIKGNYENIVYKSSQPLPVTLISFSVKAFTRGTNLLTWKTAQEKDNSHFAIESSPNGREFKEIGTVKGTNASFISEYTFEDKAPVAANIYYRLKQIDLDGTATYSPVVVCKSERGNLRVSGRELNFDGLFTGQIKLMDLNGRIVFSEKLTQQNMYRFSEKNKGGYILLIESEGSQLHSQRLIL
jgi:hypothetical protein